MTVSTAGPATAFGRQMKLWRRQSGISQLEPALRAGLFQIRVSFIETGRSRPGEDIVHKVVEALEVPIRERNTLLESAGLPARYPEVTLTDDVAAPYKLVIRKMLDAHESYPAFVINR